MDVYGWALRPTQLSPGISYHLYVGSATGAGKGLTGRKREHERGKNTSKLAKNLLQDGTLVMEGNRFVALVSISLESGEQHKVLRARQLLVLAEAVLTIWLGALAPG